MKQEKKKLKGTNWKGVDEREKRLKPLIEKFATSSTSMKEIQKFAFEMNKDRPPVIKGRNF
jgi:hypothetical protein